MFKTLKTDNTECCQDWKALCTAGRGATLCDHFGKGFGIINGAELYILYDPAILHLGINPKLKTCNRVLTDATFIIANKTEPKIHNMKKTVNSRNRKTKHQTN